MRRSVKWLVFVLPVLLLLVSATPVLAEAPVKELYTVGPTRGGANGNSIHTPPGAPVVCIPNHNPAIGEEPAEPGDVFWLIVNPDPDFPLPPCD